MASFTPKLIAFDLDGTLFKDRTASLEIGRRLGHLDFIDDLVARYSRFEISTTEVAERSATRYRGLDVSEIERMALEIPLIGGFQETKGALREHDIHILLVTVGWSFSARALVREHGLDGYAGAGLEEDGASFTGNVAQHFEETHKPEFVSNYARKNGFGISDCAAVGDSRSDIPLFKEVGLAIALNASVQARAAAHISVETDNLPHILPG